MYTLAILCLIYVVIYFRWRYKESIKGNMNFNIFDEAPDMLSIASIPIIAYLITMFIYVIITYLP